MKKTDTDETKVFKVLFFKQLQCNRNMSRNGKALHEEPYHLLIFRSYLKQYNTKFISKTVVIFKYNGFKEIR